MTNQYTPLLLLFCFAVILTGCSTILAPQEWSENYALLDGVRATNSQMIDGDLSTVGETTSQKSKDNRLTLDPTPEVIVSFPEKKTLRRIVIHSDNIKKFKLYADKGGSAIADTDWQLIKEVKSVTSDPTVVSIFYSFPTDKIRLVVLATTDDAALTRKVGTQEVGLTALSSGGT